MDSTRLSAAIVFLAGAQDGDRRMLDPLLFAPPALWCAMGLMDAGVSRFLVVCQDAQQTAARACFPEEAAFLSPGGEDFLPGVKDFLRQIQGRVAVFTKPVLFFRREAARMAAAGDLTRGESQAGAWRMGAYRLLAELEAGAGLDRALGRDGEDLGPFVTALRQGPADRANLDQAEAQRMVNDYWLSQGVHMLDPRRVYIAPTVSLSGGTTLLPGVILRGATQVGPGCEIGPDAMLEDVTVGEGTVINASQCRGCAVGSHTTVGPFAYLRPGTRVGDRVRVGDFVELKNTTVGDETKVSHLAYLGDADVGSGSDIGCGAVTVNFDGARKFRTTVGDGAFIGCNTNLVAPVQVGSGAYVAAGSTITRDVPSDSLAIARSPQTVKNQWAKKKKNR